MQGRGAKGRCLYQPPFVLSPRSVDTFDNKTSAPVGWVERQRNPSKVPKAGHRVEYHHASGRWMSCRWVTLTLHPSYAGRVWDTAVFVLLMLAKYPASMEL